MESPSRKIVCYLATSVDSQTAEAIEFLRVVHHTVTFFVPMDLLERVEEKREGRYDLLPPRQIQSVDPRAITIMARAGEEDPIVVDLVQTIFNEIERRGESRFARLANMAILDEIHRRLSPS